MGPDRSHGLSRIAPAIGHVAGRPPTALDQQEGTSPRVVGTKAGACAAGTQHRFRRGHPSNSRPGYRRSRDRSPAALTATASKMELARSDESHEKGPENSRLTGVDMEVNPPMQWHLPYRHCRSTYIVGGRMRAVVASVTAHHCFPTSENAVIETHGARAVMADHVPALQRLLLIGRAVDGASRLGLVSPSRMIRLTVIANPCVP